MSIFDHLFPTDDDDGPGPLVASLVGDALRGRSVNRFLMAVRDSSIRDIYRDFHRFTTVPRYTLRQVSQRMSQAEGIYSSARSIAKARASTVASTFDNIARFSKVAGWTMLIANIADIGASLATPGISTIASRKDAVATGPRFDDSRLAAQQRDRAMSAIHDSQISMHGRIGMEAADFHRRAPSNPLRRLGY